VYLAQASSGGNGLSSLLFFVVIAAGLYLLLIRPARARAKAMAKVRAEVAPGARVMTTAGLYAEVIEVADDATVLLEIAPGVRARFATAAVVKVLDQPADDGAPEPAEPAPPPS